MLFHHSKVPIVKTGNRVKGNKIQNKFFSQQQSYKLIRRPMKSNFFLIPLLLRVDGAVLENRFW